MEYKIIYSCLLQNLQELHGSDFTENVEKMYCLSRDDTSVWLTFSSYQLLCLQSFLSSVCLPCSVPPLLRTCLLARASSRRVGEKYCILLVSFLEQPMQKGNLRKRKRKYLGWGQERAFSSLLSSLIFRLPPKSVQALYS